MEDDILKIINNIGDAFSDLRKYILNTEHYIFYWIENNEIKQFIEDNPNDYEDLFEFKILDVDCGSARIKMEFPLSGYDETITRFMHLYTFRDTAKSKWLQYNGRINEARIEETEQNIASLKKQLEEEEKLLAELKNKSVCDA